SRTEVWRHLPRHGNTASQSERILRHQPNRRSHSCWGPDKAKAVFHELQAAQPAVYRRRVSAANGSWSLPWPRKLDRATEAFSPTRGAQVVGTAGCQGV